MIHFQKYRDETLKEYCLTSLIPQAPNDYCSILACQTEAPLLMFSLAILSASSPTKPPKSILFINIHLCLITLQIRSHGAMPRWKIKDVFYLSEPLRKEMYITSLCYKASSHIKLKISVQLACRLQAPAIIIPELRRMHLAWNMYEAIVPALLTTSLGTLRNMNQTYS